MEISDLERGQNGKVDFVVGPIQTSRPYSHDLKQPKQRDALMTRLTNFYIQICGFKWPPTWGIEF